MSITSFSFPTPTLVGPNAIQQLPQHLARLGIKRPLIVTDGGLATTSTFQMLVTVLGGHKSDQSWTLYSGVHPNPVESDVIEAAQAYRDAGCDGVIAFGGGSPLDVGKAARLLVLRPGFQLADFYEEPNWNGLAPCIAIPTTAGTGSEVGRSSVITLNATGRKKVLFHPELLARQVILDPEMTRALPPALTAATGADALTHCIESYTCPSFHPMCDAIALEGIRLIIDALPRAFADGNDIEARTHMLVAAAMGAVAFQKDLGVVHSLAHPLSTICGMHHGLANALCLIAGMRFNATRKPGLYRRVGIACGLDLLRCSDAQADQMTINFLSTFLAGLKLNTPLRTHGVNPDQVSALVAQAVEDPCHNTNAVPVSAADFRQLYLEVL